MKRELLELIKKYEGCRLASYRCPAGIWTIGYGHTAGVKPGMSCTMEQAEKWLLQDIYPAQRAVDSYDHIYRWSSCERDALISFTFNCGSANLKKLLKSGRRTKAEIAEAMLLYNKGGGKVLQGLVRRRREERELFLRQIGVEEFFPAYQGNSERIDIVMLEIGANRYYDTSTTNSWKRRLPIAQANGIANYRGTAQQNGLLISLAISGDLKRPI